MKDSTRHKLNKWFWGVILVPIVSVLFLLLLVWVFADIPSFEELENPDSKLATELISEEGEVLNTYHIENRTYVHYSQLSPQ